MDAQPVDPRDITWEVDYPTYRVTFWRRDGSASDEWRLADAVNVHEVLAWADARLKAGWTYRHSPPARPEPVGRRKPGSLERIRERSAW
jgi:hypothetical protein